MLWLVPLLPVVGAAATVGLRHRPAAVPATCLTALGAVLGTAIWAAAAAPDATWAWGPVLTLTVAAEGFARAMVVLVPAVAIPVVAYATATETEGRTRLLALLLAFVGGMQLLVLAGDFLTLLVAWELIGAISWALIAHDWRNTDAARLATQAFVTTRTGDIGLYLAAGAAFAATGSLAFADLAAAGTPWLDVVAGGVVLAAAAKSAQLPFSPWLFAAMAGPTPVSALLHSATLVAAGAFILVRLAPELGAVGWFGPAVAAIGLTTALAGGVVAAVHPHAKRVLAASTSAQHGLMFVAVGVGSATAAAAHLVAHALAKSLLFLTAGIAVHAAATSELARLRLGSALRAVAAASAVGALALAAVPPLGSAWSKEMIVAAAVDTSGWLAAGVLAAGFLSAVYAGRYHLLAFGPAGSRPRSLHHAPSRTEIASLGALAAATVASSLLWLPPAASRVEAAIDGRLPHLAAWELAVSVGLIAAAFAIVAARWRRGRLSTVGLPAAVPRAAADWFGLGHLASAGVVRPVLALAAGLARFDDRVIDAGVRAVAAVAAGGSRLVTRFGEAGVDGAVRAVAAVTLAAATGSRAADDRGVDAGVEATARGVGAAGSHSRRLQTGLSHHYYVLVAGGLAVAVMVLAFLR